MQTDRLVEAIQIAQERAALLEEALQMAATYRVIAQRLLAELHREQQLRRRAEQRIAELLDMEREDMG